MMRAEKAYELLSFIKWELDVGRGASGYDWRRARDAAAQLSVIFQAACASEE